MTVVEENRDDSKLRAAAGKSCASARDASRWPAAWKFITLPMPARIVREDLRLPASYANFYIANKCVLLPTFADRNDAKAISILEKLFPTRRIVPIDCRELIWGLGAFHCLTQQQT